MSKAERLRTIKQKLIEQRKKMLSQNSKTAAITPFFNEKAARKNSNEKDLNSFKEKQNSPSDQIKNRYETDFEIFRRLPKSAFKFPADSKAVDIIENLANFVFENGLDFENVVKSKNSQNPDFLWLNNKESLKYKYYKWQLIQKASPLNLNENDKTKKIEYFTDLEKNNKNEKNDENNSDDNDIKNDSDFFEGNGSRKNAAENASYKNAPPPKTLQAGMIVGERERKARPHMFSVIGINKQMKENSQISPNSKLVKKSINSENSKQNGENSKGNSENLTQKIKTRPRRKFSERPTGSVIKRSAGDTIAQIDFYSSQADRSDQREIVPAPPERSSSESEQESNSNEELSKNVNKNRGRKRKMRGGGRIGKGNVGHKMLRKMGWKKGQSIGKTK